MIEIDQHHRELAAAVQRVETRAVEPLLDRAAIAQAGERVLARLVALAFELVQPRPRPPHHADQIEHLLAHDRDVVADAEPDLEPHRGRVRGRQPRTSITSQHGVILVVAAGLGPHHPRRVLDPRAAANSETSSPRPRRPRAGDSSIGCVDHHIANRNTGGVASRSDTSLLGQAIARGPQPLKPRAGDTRPRPRPARGAGAWRRRPLFGPGLAALGADRTSPLWPANASPCSRCSDSVTSSPA
ncbi:MAG: hypothetical protein U0168_30475 [Nannocystaceae bacterium]